MARTSIDLSADVGELSGPEGRQLDAALIAAVTTAHIAAGGHAGDASTMEASVGACLEHGTRIGCHPSYLDREGFGRRPVDLAPRMVAEQLAAQVAALNEVARRAGGMVESVKPHGQLYHDLSVDDELLAEVCAVLDAEVLLVLPAASAALEEARRRMQWPVAEGFCDRRYEADGTLCDRGHPGALIGDPVRAANQALDLATRGLWSRGAVAHVDSLCVHSDSPDAVVMIAGVRAALEGAGIEVAPVAAPR